MAFRPLIESFITLHHLSLSLTVEDLLRALIGLELWRLSGSGLTLVSGQLRALVHSLPVGLGPVDALLSFCLHTVLDDWDCGFCRLLVPHPVTDLSRIGRSRWLLIGHLEQ